MRRAYAEGVGSTPHHTQLEHRKLTHTVCTVLYQSDPTSAILLSIFRIVMSSSPVANVSRVLWRTELVERVSHRPIKALENLVPH